MPANDLASSDRRPSTTALIPGKSVFHLLKDAFQFQELLCLKNISWPLLTGLMCYLKITAGLKMISEMSYDVYSLE